MPCNVWYHAMYLERQKGGVNTKHDCAVGIYFILYRFMTTLNETDAFVKAIHM